MLEAHKQGCTFFITKFQAGTTLITSGFQVICDPEGKEIPKIGPDPASVEKLRCMEKPTMVKQVRIFLGLLTQLSKFCPDYAMSVPNLCKLMHKLATFEWLPEHDAVKERFGNLQLLCPYVIGNQLFALTDASILRLGFILFQKSPDGSWSIL